MDVQAKHFNIFNQDEASFFTPGKQLANISRVKGEEPAIIYISPENKESVMTWRSLETLSNRIAWYFLSLGIGPGNSVVVALPNIPTHFAVAFAIWKVGACYVPIYCRTPMRNMLEICKSVSPSLVITNRSRPDSYKCLSTAELKALCSDYNDEMPPDIKAIPNLANCSGGTSGKTKVIEQNMPAGESDEGLRAWFMISGMRFEQRQLLAGPLFHGAPHAAAFNGLYLGNTLIIPASLKADNVVRVIKKYEVEYAQMVPTLMQRIIKLPDFAKDDLSSLKTLCHTGGICSSDLKEQWLEIIEPPNLYEIYSMTECIGMTCIRGDEWLLHRGSVGRMMGGEIEIRGEDGRALPAGEIGEIYMNWGEKAPKVQYRNIAPIECDARGFKTVGDMGYLDEQGYLYFADRRSDMVVTGGENVFAAEVENVLKKHKKVVDAVIIGLPDKEWGQCLHAVIEANGQVSEKELIRFALDYLPPYKIPKSFDFIKQMPRNESGKITRSLLVERCTRKD